MIGAVPSGVYQGLVSRSFLFTYFINDMASILKSTSPFFAKTVNVVGPTGRADVSSDMSDVPKSVNKWDCFINATKSHSLPRSTESRTASRDQGHMKINGVYRIKDMEILVTPDLE